MADTNPNLVLKNLVTYLAAFQRAGAESLPALAIEYAETNDASFRQKYLDTKSRSIFFRDLVKQVAKDPMLDDEVKQAIINNFPGVIELPPAVAAAPVTEPATGANQEVSLGGTQPQE